MDARTSYQRNGFVLGRGLLSTEVAERVVAIGERVHGQWMDEHRDDARQRDLVNSTALTATRYFQPPFGEQRRSFFDLLACDALVGLVSEVFGDDLYFHGTQMFFKPIAGMRRPYWHRDIQYGQFDENQQAELLMELCALHVRLPLKPEKKFLLVPGSHARWDTELERNVRLERLDHRSSDELPSGQAFDLLPGDVLLFSANMLHRGTYDGNAARLSLDLMVGKSHPRVPVAPDPDQLPTPDELARLRNPQWYRRAQDMTSAAHKILARL
jgi:ectoine hydroxylase-related dioxygenase (phytanoyl-CoA dioxygenase family)